MISVNYTKKKYITNIEISGHALFDKYGNDIVCASVSSMAILAFNICYTIDNNVSTNIDESIPLISIEIFNENNSIDLVLNSFINELKELTNQYPDNIKMNRR